MSRKLLLSGLTVLALIGSSVVPAHAATLAELPFGSVVQVMPTDTTMCSNDNCTTTTNSVLPLKFVKMQARLADGTALGDENGYSNSGSFDNSNTYTYWMFLDNYCWWGNAQCKFNNAISAQYQAYNGLSGTVDSNYSNNISMVMGDTNTDTVNPNAAGMQNNNFLNTLDHFYDSLPALVGGRDKADVVPNFTWDMRGNSNANPTVAGWYNAGTRPWQNGTYDPTPDNDSDFTFSGTSTAPIMTSRLGLPSFTEWQGGTAGWNSYAGQTVTNGSGGSFCQARFGTDCTNGGSYGLFNQVGNSLLRSPEADYVNYAWRVVGGDGYSLTYYSASNYLGVSPVLWLSSDISTTGGMGTYDSPYCLNTGECEDEEDETISSICTAADDPNGVQDIGACAWAEYDDVIGTVGMAQAITAIIEETLSISTEDNISANIIPTPGGTTTIIASNVFVSTNNASGYYLTLENTSATQDALVSGGNTIASIGGTETTLTNGTWGYKVGSMTNYKGVPLKGYAVTLSNVGQEVANDLTAVVYGVKVDTSQRTGTYTTTVLYTAISGNP